jgi:hypothetical protein
MKNKFYTALLSFLLIGSACYSHALDIDLSKLSRTEITTIYFKLGFTHIIPLGVDHILFVLGLFFLSPKLKVMLLQATAFTVAHSITLGLAIYEVISPISSVVEPIIALSIVFIGIENILVNKVNPFRIVIVFVFGLIHGLGFAGALTDLGLPRNDFFTSLIAFNVGVEGGQVAIILGAYALLGKWFGEKIWYKKRIVIPASCCIALFGIYWTIERLVG